MLTCDVSCDAKQREVDYFSITAHPKLFSAYKTTAFYQQLQFLIY